MSINDSIPECPAPFVHGWASVNPNTYPYELPAFCKPAPIPPPVSTPSIPSVAMKKPKTPNLFLPKPKIVKPKPTMTDKPTTSTSPTTARTNDKNSENVSTVENDNQHDDVNSGDGEDDDDPWGLGAPSKKKTKKVSTAVSVTDNNEVPGEDSGAFAPLPPPLADPFRSTAAEPEKVHFESDLKFDYNLLETIVRSVLLSKILLDSRRDHQKSVKILNSFKSNTAGLHPDHAQLYETYLSQAVEAVEKVQLQLNHSLNFIDEDIKSQIEELTIKHDQMLVSTEPPSWDPKPVQKNQNSPNSRAAPDNHPINENSDWGANTQTEQSRAAPSADWGANNQPEQSRAAPSADWGTDNNDTGGNSMLKKSDWGTDTGAGGNLNSDWGLDQKAAKPLNNQSTDWGTNAGTRGKPVNGNSDWAPSNKTEGNRFNQQTDWGAGGDTGGQSFGRGLTSGTGTNAGAQDSGWGAKNGGARGGNQNPGWGQNGESGRGENGGGGGSGSWGTGGEGGRGFGFSGQRGGRGAGGRGRGRDGFENDFSQSNKRGRFGDHGGDRGSDRGRGRGRGRGGGGDSGGGSSWLNSNNNAVSESTNFGWGGDDKSVSQKPANETVSSGWGVDDKIASQPINDKEPDAAKAAPAPAPIAEAFDWGDWA